MRKWILGLLATVGLSSMASAADALDPTRLRFGVNLGLSGGITVGLGADFSMNNIAQLAPNIGIGLHAGVSLYSLSPLVGGLSAAPVATFKINNGGIYVGPVLTVGLGGGGGLAIGATAGVEYNLNPSLMLYGGLDMGFSNSIAANIFAGADYDLSSQFSVFGELRTNLNAFALGLGGAYRF